MILSAGTLQGMTNTRSNLDMGGPKFIKGNRGKGSFGAKYYKATSFCVEIEGSYEDMSSYMTVVN